MVSDGAINIISTDNREVRSCRAQAELYGVFTKGDDISMYRNAAVTSTLWRLWVMALWKKRVKTCYDLQQR